MKKIGFFGGCFNPPTNIHIRIANDLVEQGKLDKVIFVPVNDYYEKENLVNSLDRYNMLKLAIEEYECLELDDIELKQNKKLFASDIFKLIEKEYSRDNNNELFMIMGSDNFEEMPQWKNYETIKDRYKYIVIKRDEKEISSTEIRKMIEENNETAKEYLPEKVYKYILENKLYKED